MGTYWTLVLPTLEKIAGTAIIPLEDLEGKPGLQLYQQSILFKLPPLEVTR